MNNNAVITVVSVQNNDNEDKIEVVSPGVFYKEGDIYKVEYEETELSGLGDTVTTYEIGKSHFNLIREGEINARMEFKKGHVTTILYNTPHGALTLQVRTKTLKISVNDFGGDVDISYDVLVDGQESISTKLQANIVVKK